MGSRIAVLGAGSWGTALAMQLGRVGHSVKLWARDASHVDAMSETGENARYLPGCPLSDSIEPTADLGVALEGVDRILLAVPSSAFAKVLDGIGDDIDVGRGLAWATKGFEPGTGRLLSEYARERLGS